MCARPTPGRHAAEAEGNYLTARVGNYVTDNPSDLGNSVTADNQLARRVRYAGTRDERPG